MSNGISQLHLRELDQFDARPIAGTSGARDPFFSPDGEWVAFFTSRELKKVSVRSGALVTLCNAASVSSGGYWGPDGTIHFTMTPVNGLVRTSADGGTPQTVTTPDSTQGEFGHHHPEALPGGKALLFTSTGSAEWLYEQRHAVLSLESGVWRSVTERGSRPHYLLTGHLVYFQTGALVAAPFDLNTLQTSGPPVRVLEGVRSEEYKAQFSVSANGSLVYVPDTGAGNILVWVDRQGNVQPTLFPPGSYGAPRLSPDGTSLVVDSAPPPDIWLGKLTPPLVRFSFGGNFDGRPIWTPDGKHVIFSSVREGQAPNLVLKPADGTGPEELIEMTEHEQLNTVEHGQWATSLSPDGHVLAFNDEHSETGSDIWLVDMKGQRKPQPWLVTKFTETAAAFSPEGRWIAYQSDESGRFEIYVRPFPGPGPAHRVSTDSGTEPLWLRNGRELFYRNGNAMIALTVDTGQTFVAGEPRVLFEGFYAADRICANYDVSPDGLRFLMI